MQNFIFDHGLLLGLVALILVVACIAVAYMADPFSIAVPIALVCALLVLVSAGGVAVWHDEVARDRWYRYAADAIVAKYDITIDQWGPLDTDGGVWVINGEATTCGTGWTDDTYTDVLLVCGGVEQKVR